jgi:hypothetical protein
MDANFEKQYTVSSGRVFMRFFASDGRSAEIMTRTGYHDSPEPHLSCMPIWTRGEAKALALVHFLGKCAGEGTCPVTVHRA